MNINNFNLKVFLYFSSIFFLLISMLLMSPQPSRDGKSACYLVSCIRSLSAYGYASITIACLLLMYPSFHKFGSADFSGVFPSPSYQEYSIASLYIKNLMSPTPLNCPLNALIFALKDSAEAFVSLSLK